VILTEACCWRQSSSKVCVCVCVCLPDQQQDGGDFDRGLLLEAEFFESATVQGAFQDKGKEKARVHMAADSGTQPATEPGGRGGGGCVAMYGLAKSHRAGAEP
jgi:hypothetical protein